MNASRACAPLASSSESAISGAWLAASMPFDWKDPLGPLNRLWLKFGLLLYKVMNPLILGLLFFVTIMPIGLVMRAFGKDFLRLKLDRNAKSYWIDRSPPGPPPQSMKNQF